MDEYKVAKDVVENFERITGRSTVEVMDVDSMTFNNTAIDETAPDIHEYVWDKYGFDMNKDYDFLEELDKLILQDVALKVLGEKI